MDNENKTTFVVWKRHGGVISVTGPYPDREAAFVAAVEQWNKLGPAYGFECLPEGVPVPKP